MNILVRLPNWLGDVVMSMGFMQALKIVYPSAQIDVIIKKGLEPLAEFIPSVSEKYIFSRSEWKGFTGAYRFGKKIGRKKKYDVFFCLPDSFSSAAMAYGTDARERIGFKKENRSFLLTGSYTKKAGLHRVEEYILLLSNYTKQNILPQIPKIIAQKQAVINKRVIINFNSEAVSRRMPADKALSILNAMISEFPATEFVLIGSEKEIMHTDAILGKLNSSVNIVNKTGKTKTIKELIDLIGTGSVMLSTDSGPAHLANAMDVPLVVLFGAGNESNTGPYNRENSVVIRLGQLPCEPCEKNTCQFGSPKCLEQMNSNMIVSAVKRFISE